MRQFVVVVMVGLMVLAVGCRPSDRRAAAIGSSSGSIMVKGSDTMVHLVTAWAEAYRQAQPDVEVSVTGGGSGTGIAALLSKTTDICAASREMTATEKGQAAQGNMHPVETVVARDGIAVIVHPSNPVGELTLEQLRKVFTGALTQWSDVGGGPGEFIVLSRETSSGTYIFFQEHVLQKEDYTPKARLMPATSAIIQSVSADAQAIGYVGLGYALEAKDTVKILRIKAGAGGPAIEPSEETVRDGTYSISRPLYFYTADAPSAAVQQFINHCLGEAGQMIVRQTGYVPVG